MLDAIYLILVFTSNDEAVNSLAAEITEISAANKLQFSTNYRYVTDLNIKLNGCLNLSKH